MQRNIAGTIQNFIFSVDYIMNINVYNVLDLYNIYICTLTYKQTVTVKTILDSEKMLTHWIYNNIYLYINNKQTNCLNEQKIKINICVFYRL